MFEMKHYWKGKEFDIRCPHGVLGDGCPKCQEIVEPMGNMEWMLTLTERQTAWLNAEHELGFVPNVDSYEITDDCHAVHQNKAQARKLVEGLQGFGCEVNKESDGVMIWAIPYEIWQQLCKEVK